MDKALLDLFLIFFPGIIWVGTVQYLTDRIEDKQFSYIVRAFSFGLGSYILYFLTLFGLDKVIAFLQNNALLAPYDIDWPEITLPFRIADTANIDTLVRLTFVDVVCASILALVAAIAWSRGVNRGTFLALLRRLKIIDKDSDDDVWERTFSSGEEEFERVLVRDLESGLSYTGWVRSFSKNSEIRELLLEKVEIYAPTPGAKPIKREFLYLLLKNDRIHIEFL
ncbi:MAG: DUF6338 family protein [Alphaproteobacteria bacterium]